MKKLLLILLPLVLLFPVFCSCGAETPAEEIPYVNELIYDLAKKEGSADLVVFRVGMADAMLVSTQNCTILVNAGEKDDTDADKIIAYLETQAIDTLDAVIVSNLLTDNIGGLEKLYDAVKIKAIYYPEYNPTGHRYTKFLRSALSHGAELYPISVPTDAAFDDVTFTLTPAKNPVIYQTEADMSMAIALTHGNNTFLIPGNIGTARIAEMMAEQTGPYKVLMLPDHGVWFDDLGTMLEQYAPMHVLITDSKLHEVSYEVLSLLADKGLAYYRTKDGYICLHSQDNKVTVKLK